MRVAYFTGTGKDKQTDQVYGTLTGSAVVTPTGTSASAGTVPEKTALARIKAEETCVVSNNGTAAADTNGVYMASGDIIDLVISEGSTLLVKTTT